MDFLSAMLLWSYFICCSEGIVTYSLVVVFFLSVKHFQPLLEQYIDKVMEPYVSPVHQSDAFE